jgi:hypothetical protein
MMGVFLCADLNLRGVEAGCVWSRKWFRCRQLELDSKQKSGA